jgi:hypothetical protein
VERKLSGNEVSLRPRRRLEEAPRATLEDVPDDDDLKHGEQPVSSSILDGLDDVPTPEWVPPMSEKAAGKQKENESQKENKPLLDTQSEELFPGLGGAPKPKQATASKPTWNFGKAGLNGSSATNGANGIPTNGTSTPTSGMDTKHRYSKPIIIEHGPLAAAIYEFSTSARSGLPINKDQIRQFGPGHKFGDMKGDKDKYVCQMQDL